MGMKGVIIRAGDARVRVGAEDSVGAAGKVPVVFTDAARADLGAGAEPGLIRVRIKTDGDERGGQILVLPKGPEWTELARAIASAPITCELPLIPGVGKVVDAAGGHALIENGRKTRATIAGEASPGIVRQAAIGVTDDHSVVVATPEGRNSFAAAFLFVAMKSAGCVAAVDLGPADRVAIRAEPFKWL